VVAAAAAPAPASPCPQEMGIRLLGGRHWMNLLDEILKSDPVPRERAAQEEELAHQQEEEPGVPYAGRQFELSC